MANKEKQSFDPKSKKGTVAIENNPCEKCRAAGNLTCKCVGGREGDSSKSEKKEKTAFTSNNNFTATLPIPNPEKQEEKEIARQEKNRLSPFSSILKGPKPKGMG